MPGAQTSSPLQILRLLMASLAGTLVAIGVVVVVLDSGGGLPGDAVPASAAGAAVAVVGTATLALLLTLRLPLDCSSPATLVGSYRTRLIVRMAIAEMPALVGFVAFILTAAPLLYPLGAAFTAIGLWWIAPRAANLERDQETLSWSGCGTPLGPALRGELSAD